MIYPAIVTSRMDEHIAAAEKSRALRALPQHKSAMTALRVAMANLLVRVGQRLSPPAPAIERESEHVLIRLAR
jgi:hypothetical protein